MEKEISSGAMVGVILIALASTIGLGYGVFAITTGDMATDVPSKLVVLNTTVLAITSMLSWVTLGVACRLSYLNSNYYANRFKFSKELTTNLNAKYIENAKLSIFQVCILLFRPVRYKKIECIAIDNSTDLQVTGKLRVVDNLLFIKDCYLALNTDLFEYIDREVSLTLKVSGYKQGIERNLLNYEVLQVEVL